MKCDNAFTNGPWTFSDEYGKLTIRGCEGCWPVLEIPQRRYGETDATVARLKADVRLMAAAPELLGILERLSDALAKIHPTDRGDGLMVRPVAFTQRFLDQLAYAIRTARGAE